MGEPLDIETRPQSRTVSENEEATFTVSVKGGTEPYTYQWKYSHNGGSWLVCREETAITPTLTVAAEGKDGYQYICVITDKNGKEVTSEPATLTVTPAVAVTSSDPALDQNDEHIRLITLNSQVPNDNSEYFWIVQFSTTNNFQEETTWNWVEVVAAGSTGNTIRYPVVPNMKVYYRSILGATGGAPMANLVATEATAHYLETGTIGFYGLAENVRVNTSGSPSYEFTASEAGEYTLTASSAYKLIPLSSDNGKVLTIVQTQGGPASYDERSFTLSMAANETVYMHVKADQDHEFTFLVTNGTNPSSFIFEMNSDTVNNQTGGLTVAQYTGSDSVVTVNETYYNTTVTRIGEAAFKNNTTITTVYLPDTVQVIEKQAFMGCTNLSSMGISSPNSNG